MSLGPIEVVVLTFPGSRFDGTIVPELASLLEAGTISLVDAVLAVKDTSGDTTFVEIDAASEDESVQRVAELFDRVDELISDEDVLALTTDLPPGSTAAILAFEHTWVKPLRDAIVRSGGELAATIRIPGAAVDEVLDALAAAG